MATDIQRRSVICSCGGDVFSRTWNFVTADSEPIWRCENCGAESPRKKVSRRTNHHRAIDAYLAIREDWKAIDDALTALVNDGKAASGSLLVHSSVFNYHLKQLTDKETPSNWDVRYHAEQAREDLRKAVEFVKDKKESL